MIDYFALLDEPRQPWLDEQRLKEKFHALTLRHHPDLKHSGEQDFSALNEAYAVLSDPRRRLKHLLALAGEDASRTSEVPPQLEELFWRTGTLLREADALLSDLRNATHQLARAVINARTASVRQQLSMLLAEIRDAHLSALRDLERLNDSWRDRIPQLVECYRTLSYTSRWLEQLQQRELQFATG